MYQYGATDFGDASRLSRTRADATGDFDTELVQASTADVVAPQHEHGQFDFRFLLHAGYDESGAWLNYGQAMFETKETRSRISFGPANPITATGRTPGTSRLVLFLRAQQIWSHALPGCSLDQGESDGGSTTRTSCRTSSGSSITTTTRTPRTPTAPTRVRGT